MPKYSKDYLRRLINQFRVEGRVTDVAPYGSGHINDTFAVHVRTPRGVPLRYCLQRINHYVFKNPHMVMENIGRVTEHLRQKLAATPGGDLERETLNLLRTHGDQTMFHSEDDEYWRMYVFIEGAETFDVVEDPQQVFEAARAFARFQKLLDDLPGDRLHDTILYFHDTPSRYVQLRHVLAVDKVRRVAPCRAEIDFYLDREDRAGMVVRAMARGTIPERVTHNDTKINNVMMDVQTKKAICVVDLDTVMPGCSLFDFGDMVRSTGGCFAENEQDLSKVALDLARFRLLVAGYLSEAHAFLTPPERDLMPFSGWLLTLECGVRFLTDYLDGDRYFRIGYPTENLDRARSHIAYVRDLERQMSEMEQLVRDWRPGVGAPA